MNTVRLFIRCFVFSVSALLISSCSQKDPVDNFLDEYEEVVTKWEKSGKSLSLVEISEISSQQIKLGEKANELKQGNKWSDAQLDRMNKLIQRQAKVITSKSGLQSPQNSPRQW